MTIRVPALADRVYRNTAALDVEMSNEVRGIMDRLLATEEEIREAAL